MTSQSDISNETINALVDGELNHEEQLELLEHAAISDEVKQKICDAHRLKAMVAAAYPLDQRSSPVPERRRFIGYASAAAIGALSLFSINKLIQEPGLSPTQQDMRSLTQVLFHISDDNGDLAKQLLDQVEFILTHYQSNDRTIEVEVVANNEGLRLLQVGKSSVATHIDELSQRYPNLTFAACGSTMERLVNETGESIRILPPAIIIRSGVTFIARRQAQGWSYIKV